MAIKNCNKVFCLKTFYDFNFKETLKNMIKFWHPQTSLSSQKKKEYEYSITTKKTIDH